MDIKTINSMNLKQYSKFINNIDPDSMGNEDGIEGVQEEGDESNITNK